MQGGLLTITSETLHGPSEWGAQRFGDKEYNGILFEGKANMTFV